jgi:acyl carrier protein
MDQSTIYAKLTEIFHSVFDDESIELAPTTSAADIAEWDSLSHIRLVVSVEKAFSIRLSASEVGKLQNVGEFVELIQGKSAGR